MWLPLSLWASGSLNTLKCSSANCWILYNGPEVICSLLCFGMWLSSLCPPAGDHPHRQQSWPGSTEGRHVRRGKAICWGERYGLGCIPELPDCCLLSPQTSSVVRFVCTASNTMEVSAKERGWILNSRTGQPLHTGATVGQHTAGFITQKVNVKELFLKWF